MQQKDGTPLCWNNVDTRVCHAQPARAGLHVRTSFINNFVTAFRIKGTSCLSPRRAFRLPHPPNHLSLSPAAGLIQFGGL